MAAAICVPTPGKRVIIAGAAGPAGRETTVLLQGNRADVAIWGSAISLMDITLSDALAPGEQVRLMRLTSLVCNLSQAYQRLALCTARLRS